MKIIYRSDRKFFKKQKNDLIFKNFFFSNLEIKNYFIFDNFFFLIFNEKIKINNYLKKINKEKNSIFSLYKRYGINYLIKLFSNNCSIVIIDLEKKNLFINNDIFGTTPLYFLKKNNNELIISDQIKSIIEEHRDYKFNEDFLLRFSFSHYRYIEWINETPIKKIKKIPLSHFLKVQFERDFSIKNIELKRWINFDYKIDYYKKNNSFIRKKIVSHMKSSLTNELINPSKTLFSLSGGLDSSSLVALYRKLFPSTKINTATITYDDKTYSEKDDVSIFLKTFKKKIEWHNINIRSKGIDKKIIDHCSKADYPFHTVTWFVDSIFKTKIKKYGFNSYVSGLGGDQLNAGEYDYFHYFFADLMKNKNKKKLENEINFWIKNHDHPIFRKNFDKEFNFIKNQIKNRFNFYGNTQVFKYYNFSLKNRKEIPLNFFKLRSYLTNKTLNEINFEMLPVCLISDYNNSKTNHIKNIYPYLNYHHFNTMLSASNSLKINCGVQKYLFRDALSNITPEYTLNKIRKTGWNAPAHLWLSSKNTNLLNDIINSQDFRECGLYNVKKIRNLYNKHNKIVTNKQSEENHMMFFWQLTSVNIWKNSIKNIAFNTEN